jgi:hypothetical protein
VHLTQATFDGVVAVTGDPAQVQVLVRAAVDRLPS